MWRSHQALWEKWKAALIPLGLVASLIFPAKASAADGSDEAAAAARERATRMQRFIVSATRVDKNPWLYASLPGFEVLSRAPAKETSRMLDSLQRGMWLQNDVMPKDWLPASPIPYTVIIDDTDMSTVSIGQMHSQPIKLQAPVDAVAWGRWSNDTLIWTNRIPAFDNDTLAFNTNVFGVAMKSIGYGSISMERLGRCAPPLPRWLLAGLIGPTSGVFREGFVPFVSKGIFGAGWIHRADGPGTLWVSVGETERLLKQLEHDKALGGTTQIPLLPLAELFAEAPPPPDRLGLWESEAALLVRWGLMGPGRQGTAEARAFLELVRRSRTAPITEQVFTDCFGFGYAPMEEKLVLFLRSVLAQPTSVQLDMPSEFPKPSLKTATADQIGRILGDWLRMQGNSLISTDPDTSKESLYYGGRMLERAYRDDNGLSPDVDPSRRMEHTDNTTSNAAFGSATAMKPFVVTSDRIHDPGLLAVFGLYEHDAGNDEKAREFLEAAARSGVDRPVAYVVLAGLRYAEAMRAPSETDGKLGASQVESILEPLRVALRVAPTEEAIGLLVATWANGDARPDEADVDEIVKGVLSYPRNSDLAYTSAVLCVRSDYPSQAATLIDEGLVFTTHEATREYFRQMRSSLAPAPPAAH
jgi:hypothetical protein